MNKISRLVLAFSVILLAAFSFNPAGANIASPATSSLGERLDSLSSWTSIENRMEQKLEGMKTELQADKAVEIFSLNESAENIIAQADKKESKKMTEETQVEIKDMEAKELKEVAEGQEIADKYVIMKTEKGDLTIKLYMADAPITAGNFLDLVKRGFYSGLTFHRIIPGFVVQGGCPKGDGTGGFIDPETKKERRIKHEWSEKHSHSKAGILAMARTANPDSASSQFFIDLAPLPSLNPGGVDPYGYSVFGEVVDGMEHVETIVKENVPPYPGSDGTANPVKILSIEVKQQ